MSDHGPSPELEELAQRLRRISFRPRDSFEPELFRRLERGEAPALRPASFRRRWTGWLLLGGLAATVVIGLLSFHPRVVIDRCCFDLDGGTVEDDGVRVLAQRDGRVYRLSIYEDQDGSRSFTTTDVVRLDRRGTPAYEPAVSLGLTEIRRCCDDLDGGGPADDALLVLVQPPDRVLTAAIYELR